MKGSLHLATVTGIPVKIHWSFGLLLLWVVFETSRGDDPDLTFILISIGIVLSVFFCVILHEFGHALAARKFGVKTFDIVMTPIGGIARLERMPEGRGEEFWVAIAGPVVNFVIVGLIWLGYVIVEGENLPIFSMSFWSFERQADSYFKIIMMANGYLGVFNLLPAFPMDGGRMLRSLLSLKLDRSKATQIASYAGQFIALIMFGLGIYRQQPTLTLIGVFIFFAARQEYQSLARQTRMNSFKIINLMQPIQHLLFTGQRMDEAKAITKDLKDSCFIVWSRPGIPAGYITRDRLTGYPPPSPDSLLDAWIIPAPVAVAPQLSAAQLYNLMQQHKLPLALVFDGTNYIGVVHWEAVSALTK
jgi:Zn-dependent protease